MRRPHTSTARQLTVLLFAVCQGWIVTACGSVARPIPRTSQAAKATDTSASQNDNLTQKSKPDAADPGFVTDPDSPVDNPQIPPPLNPDDDINNPEPSYSLSDEIRESIFASLERIGRISTTFAQTNEQIQKTSAVNEAFCRIAKAQQNNCPALGSLMPSLSPVSQSCSDGLNSPQERTLWVQLNFPPGTAGVENSSFVLRTRIGDLVSSPFTAGTRTSISWSGPGRIGRIYEINQLELSSSDGLKLPPYSKNIQFTLGTQIEGSDWPLLTSESLLGWVKNSTTAGIVTQSLANSVNSPSCVTTPEELEAAAGMALRQIAIADRPENVTSPVADDVSSTETELNKEKQRLESIESELTLSLNTARTNLESEHGRNGKIRASIRTNANTSCQAQRPIGTIEIFLIGDHLEDSDWDRSSSDIIKTSEGNPDRISISLGDGLEIMHPSELANPILTSAGYLRTDAFANRLVNDITEIKVKKHGTGYRSELNCWSIIGWSKWGLGKDCEYHNRETHRYTMDKIRIALDGQTFFESQLLENGLFGGNRVWQESDLTKSNDYINFMTTNTCKEN